MPGQLEKHELRESFKKHIPKRFHDIVFGNETSTSTWNHLWQAMQMHVGEMELIARREYERGYDDGKAGKPPRKYSDK